MEKTQTQFQAGRSWSWSKPTDQLDLWLDSQGLYRKHTARDSTCLFRAVSEQVFLTQAHHDDVRRQILDYMLRHRHHFSNKMAEMGLEEDFDSHVGRMRNQREWGGLVELYAIASYFRTEVYVRIGQEGEQEVCQGFSRRIMLCLTQERHYDSLYTKNYINDSAFCQAVLYEALYKGVFRLDQVDYAVSKMLHDKTEKLTRDHLGLFSPSLEDERLELRDRCTDVKQLLDLGITPFPYKVAKALDTEIYRNVEFDVWNDYRKGLRYGLCSWSCKEIQVGVKCQVKTPEGEVYLGHVQDVQPNKGPVLVYVLQLGQKISVPFEWLQVVAPPPPPVPTPTKTSDRPLSDLFGKLKEAASRKTCLAGFKESTQVPLVSCDVYPDTAAAAACSTYQQYNLYQEDESSGQAEVVEFPDSTKSGDEVYLMEQSDEMMAAAPRSDAADFPNTATAAADVNTLRFFYNLGVEHMRMNCVMRPYYLGLPPVCLPVDSAAQAVPSDQQVSGSVREDMPIDAEDQATQMSTVRFNKTPQQPAQEKRNSQAYEGAPLIQQYEVSSTTGSAPPAAPLYYHQPVELDAVPQYTPVYLPTDYPPPPPHIYAEYAPPAVPAYQPVPSFQYLPADPQLYYIPHFPQPPP